jgi:plastocyanin
LISSSINFVTPKVKPITFSSNKYHIVELMMVYIFQTILAITIAASLLLCSINAQQALSVTAGKENYVYGGTVSITGNVPSYVEGAKGSLKILTSKNNVFLETTFTPKPDRTFSYAFKLEGTFLEEGIWTARVSYQGNNAITNFTVLAQELLVVDVDITIGSTNQNNGKFFDPKEITIKKGIEVVWHNKDVTAHTIIYGQKGSSDAGSVFDSGMIRSNTVYSHSFTDTGDYPYFCKIHSWMTGRIIVAEDVQVPIIVELSMSTEKPKYKLGDTVKVTGTAHPVQEEDVVMRVFNPVDAQFALEELKLLDDGKFSHSFPLKGDLAVAGNYTIMATYLNKTISSVIIVEEIPIPAPQPQPDPEPPKAVSKIAAERVSFVDVTGSEKNSLGVGEQVLVKSKLSNTLGIQQEFAFIVQVKDSDGVVVMLSWFESTLNAKQTVKVAQSWTPDSEGRFTVQAFVWKSALDPSPLTIESLQTTIKVL